MAGKARRARWQILPHQHRQILSLLRSGHGICKTAAIVGVGVRTVQRRAEIMRTASLEQGEDDYRRAIKPRRCPTHGLVVVWPCVACAAVAHSGPPARAETDADSSDAAGDGDSTDHLAERSAPSLLMGVVDLQRGIAQATALYLDPPAPQDAASFSQGR